MWGRWNPVTADENASWCNHSGKNLWRLLKNLNINLPYDPAIPLLVMGHSLLQRHLHTHVYCSAIHNSQVMDIAKIPYY
jgi:hypothetical protein